MPALGPWPAARALHCPLPSQAHQPGPAAQPQTCGHAARPALLAARGPLPQRWVGRWPCWAGTGPKRGRKSWAEARFPAPSGTASSAGGFSRVGAGVQPWGATTPAGRRLAISVKAPGPPLLALGPCPVAGGRAGVDLGGQGPVLGHNWALTPTAQPLPPQHRTPHAITWRTASVQTRLRSCGVGAGASRAFRASPPPSSRGEPRAAGTGGRPPDIRSSVGDNGWEAAPRRDGGAHPSRGHSSFAPARVIKPANKVVTLPSTGSEPRRASAEQKGPGSKPSCGRARLRHGRQAARHVTAGGGRPGLQLRQPRGSGGKTPLPCGCGSADSTGRGGQPWGPTWITKGQETPRVLVLTLLTRPGVQITCPMRKEADSESHGNATSSERHEPGTRLPAPRPPQPDAGAGLPAEPLPGCALRPPLRDAGQRPPGHPGHEAAELTVRPPPHSRAGRGAARVRGHQCACPWKQPGTRHAPGTERLLRPLRGGLAARPGPHLGEVVLRELLLLQHGCALQRVRVDLLARDLLVLLSWKRAGSAVRGHRPVLVGTPEARPAAVERPRRAEGLRGPSPRPACTAPARGRAAA